MDEKEAQEEKRPTIDGMGYTYNSTFETTAVRKTIKTVSRIKTCARSGAPGLVDRVFTVHAGNRGFDSHRRHMFERFFRSSRPGYPNLMCSELEK